MKIVSKLFLAALCVAYLLAPRAATSQVIGGFPVQLPNLAQTVLDLRPNGGNTIVDALTQTVYTSGSSIHDAPSSTFTSNSTSFAANSTINLPVPANWSTYGFTIAAQLNTANAPTVGTVFTLVDANANSNSLLFALIRDSNGRWWTGKRRDAEATAPSFVWYTQETWDPYSPCVSPVVCTTDTVYVSFLTNGQIQLDEVATFQAASSSLATDQYDWESGLLNFGLPQQGYNVGDDGAEDPVSALQTTVIGGIQLTGLQAAQFGSGSILGKPTYPAFSLNRLAVFDNPSMTPGYGVLNSQVVIGNSTNVTNSTNGIMRDQTLVNQSLTPQTAWLPCSSGQYEQPPGTGDALTVQYDPANLPTPCNVPSAPQSVVATNLGSGNVKVSWRVPVYPGASPVGGAARIQGYQVTANDNQDVPLTCGATGAQTSCQLTNVLANTAYDISVTAQGIGGNSSTVAGYSPAAVYAYRPQGLAPNPPTNLTANQQPTANAAVVTWTAATVPPGASPVTSYTLVYEQVFPTTINNVTSPYTLTNLLVGEFTSIKVSANNSAGTSQPASVGLYIAPIPPDAPTDLNPTLREGEIDLSWSAPANQGSFPVTSYSVALTPYLPPGTPQIVNQSKTTIQFLNLNSYVGYQASVNAVSASTLPGPAVYSPILYPKFQAPQWTTCASNNGTCNAPAGSMVLYGDSSRNSVFYATASGGNLGCNSTNFNGTPNGAVTIACSYASQSLMPPPPPGYTFCAYSSGTCYYPFPGMVAFGGGGQFVYSPTSGSSLICKPADFPAFNPALAAGTPTSCFYQGTVNVPGIEWCANGETGVCRLGEQPAFVGYGFDAQLTYVNMPTGGSIACESSSFNNANPVPGFQNSCYIVPYNAVPYAPAGGTFCATDANVCYLSTTNNAVSRGANGYYTTISVPASGPFTCSASNFPYDAAKGMTEACFYNGNVQTYPPNGTVCASEFGTCSEPMNGNQPYVVYGSSTFNGSAAYVSVPSSFQQVFCSPLNFGSVVGSSPRSCYQANFATALTIDDGLSFPPYFHFCSPQAGSCPAFGGSSPGYLYVYGSGGIFYSRRVQSYVSSIACNATSFAGDPNPGTVEYCGEMYSPSGLDPSLYTLCAADNGSCTISGNQTVWAAFGFGLSYVFKQVSGTFACNAETFGVDPAPGLDSCWYSTKP